MAKHAKTVSLTTGMKASPATNSGEDKDFLFGWEGLSAEPLMYEARGLVDMLWPDTPTPEIVGGVWDDTPIMRAVVAALKRGIEIGQGDEIATA